MWGENHCPRSALSQPLIHNPLCFCVSGTNTDCSLDIWDLMVSACLKEKVHLFLKIGKRNYCSMEQMLPLRVSWLHRKFQRRKILYSTFWKHVYYMTLREWDFKKVISNKNCHELSRDINANFFMSQEISFQLQKNKPNHLLIWLEMRYLHRRHKECLIHFSSRQCCGHVLCFVWYSNALPNPAWRIQQPIPIEGEYINFSCLFSGPVSWNNFSHRFLLIMFKMGTLMLRKFYRLWKKSQRRIWLQRCWPQKHRQTNQATLW